MLNLVCVNIIFFLLFDILRSVFVSVCDVESNASLDADAATALQLSQESASDERWRQNDAATDDDNDDNDDNNNNGVVATTTTTTTTTVVTAKRFDGNCKSNRICKLVDVVVIDDDDERATRQARATSSVRSIGRKRAHRARNDA